MYVFNHTAFRGRQRAQHVFFSLEIVGTNVWSSVVGLMKLLSVAMKTSRSCQSSITHYKI